MNKSALINIENVASGTPESFVERAITLFNYQCNNNTLYNNFCRALHIVPSDVKLLTDIPFLPISFFKSHAVKSGDWDQAELTFESSGTTGETTSKHMVRDVNLYEASMQQGWNKFYGTPQQYAILALLPSYLERSNASLVYMAKRLMELSGHPANGFYINEWESLKITLEKLEAKGQKTILIGVTFALLDFATENPMQLKNTQIIETGGMKGRREEWTRAQVHSFLKQQWGLNEVHSEYGMTELLSQAYALKDGIFECSDSMRVLVRDINDPLEVSESGSGCINVIDLANVYSCAFIATEDIGKIHTDHRFEVLGRMDHSALRGCSLMAL